MKEKTTTLIPSLLVLAVVLWLVLTGCSDSNESGQDVVRSTPEILIGKVANESPVPIYMRDSWLCTDQTVGSVDDLTTAQVEGFRCSIKVEYTERFAIIRSNGIPNHDFDSGLGCCAAENHYEWKIPLHPIKTNQVEYVPERGAIAISVNGVPFFGPEEGPGGDAVALHFNYFVEDRQPIVLGLCGAHSAGTIFHYHYDGNCVHWHPEQEGKSWTDWMMDLIKSDKASPVIGFAFDGYPIYGPYGYGKDGILKEMLSSYSLKKGKNGYGGIEDWEYIEGLGDLDRCNGIESKIPGSAESFYHYHATFNSGSGQIGFPYFLLCYSGIVERLNFSQSIDQGVGPPGRGPQGNRPDLEKAAAKLGVTVIELQNALGGPPPDIESAARTLGITVKMLQNALKDER
tara:strand:- start:9632 stop:10834 length:1203 start_codon:yes stop_codon:yes gene_type:complete